MGKEHDSKNCRSMFTTDHRQDNQWHPPEQETRLRCLNCGWQGPWMKVKGMMKK